MSQNARIGKVAPVISQVNVARISLKSQSLSDWQNAVNAARNEFLPRRKQLLELYENLRLDGHLNAVMTKRITNVTNKRVVWEEADIDEAKLKVIEEDVLNTPWFYDLLAYSMEARFYGFTLLELQMEAGKVARCEVFPRANVVPEFGYIAKDATNPSTPWLYFREDPKYSTYLIEVGKPKDLGAMLIAVPDILRKQGALGDWAQFAELFGMPFRVGKYNPFDADTRSKLLQALAEMGGAGHAVIPQGTEIEFHQVSAGSGQAAVYADLVKECNAELSKLFLGQTMTTDNGSSRSQSEVHKEVEEGITLADMRWLEHLLNWELKERLVTLGYPMADGLFRFDMTLNLPLEKRILVDEKLAKQLGGLPESYWRNTYNVPEPTPEEAKAMEERRKMAAKEAKAKEPSTGAGDAPPKEEEEEEDEEEDPEGSDSMSARVRAYYTEHHGHGHTSRNVAVLEDDGTSDPIMQELAQAIHDGRITDGWVDPKLMQWTADKLTKSLFEGMDIDDEAPATPELRTFFQENIAVFSGFKTYATLRAATDELLDEAGELRSFGEFKKRILAIDKEYNVRYLQAEYQHAVASSQMAERWQDIQRDKELFPNLRLVTAGDDRVRASHDALDGIVRPVDDEFWDTHMPPLDWQCRCDVEQTTDEASGELPEVMPNRPAMFSNNPGKTGIIFPESHPYFDAPDAIVREVEQAADRSSARHGTDRWKGIPVPAIPDGPATRPAGVPVSTNLKVKVRGEKQDKLKAVLDVINSVHGDGELPEIPLVHDVASVFGDFTEVGGPLRIRINFSDPHYRIHIIHEVAHWLDNSVLRYNQRGVWGSFNARNMPDHPMRPLYNAITKSKATKHLQAIVDLKKVPKAPDGSRIELLDEELYEVRDYLLQPEELFARAYTQYIVEKSGDATLMEDIVTWDRRRFNGDLRRHWDPQDFAPIRKAFDQLFKREGWLND
ncbi:MAG TPA: DUF935 family protein [Flavobacteriales bacterium]|nr:DUF935 family protein [Flavobacteriales bacterium]